MNRGGWGGSALLFWFSLFSQNTWMESRQTQVSQPHTGALIDGLIGGESCAQNFFFFFFFLINYERCRGDRQSAKISLSLSVSGLTRCAELQGAVQQQQDGPQDARWTSPQTPTRHGPTRIHSSGLCVRSCPTSSHPLTALPAQLSVEPPPPSQKQGGGQRP